MQSAEDARKNLFLALWELRADGRVPRDPLSVLFEDFGALTKNSAGRFHYIATHERHAVAERWAREFAANKKPPTWLVSWAEARAPIAEATPIGGNGARMPLPLLGVLIIPMQDPSRYPHEDLGAYKKRVRKAVTAYLRRVGSPNSRKAAIGPKPVGKLAAYKLDHYKWFILFQWCKWTLRQIRTEFTGIGTERGVSLAIHRTAKLLGIAPRERLVNKNQYASTRNLRLTPPHLSSDAD